MPKRLFFFSLTNLPFILRKYLHFLFPAYELKAKQPKYRKRKNRHLLPAKRRLQSTKIAGPINRLTLRMFISK